MKQGVARFKGAPMRLPAVAVAALLSVWSIAPAWSQSTPAADPATKTIPSTKPKTPAEPAKTTGGLPTSDKAKAKAAAKANPPPPPPPAGPPPTGVRALTNAVGVTTEVPQAQDFVRNSRPAEMEYRPVGVVPPARSIAPRKADQVKSLEAELEATRKRHDSMAGRKFPPPVGAAKPGAPTKPATSAKAAAKADTTQR